MLNVRPIVTRLVMAERSRSGGGGCRAATEAVTVTSTTTAVTVTMDAPAVVWDVPSSAQWLLRKLVGIFWSSVFELRSSSTDCPYTLIASSRWLPHRHLLVLHPITAGTASVHRVKSRSSGHYAHARRSSNPSKV
jgi:hypothetical protein